MWTNLFHPLLSFIVALKDFHFEWISCVFVVIIFRAIMTDFDR